VVISGSVGQRLPQVVFQGPGRRRFEAESSSLDQILHQGVHGHQEVENLSRTRVVVVVVAVVVVLMV